MSRLDAARTREMLAAMDPGRRTALLEAALATYERLGAGPSIAAARSALAASADASAVQRA